MILNDFSLCGFFPFSSNDNDSLRQKIITADFSFPSSSWSHISVYGTIWSSLGLIYLLAKDFIKCLLVPEPSKRYTAVQAFKHPWIQGNVAVPNSVNIRSSMETFVQSQRKLRESGTDYMVIGWHYSCKYPLYFYSNTFVLLEWPQFAWTELLENSMTFLLVCTEASLVQIIPTSMEGRNEKEFPHPLFGKSLVQEYRVADDGHE